MLSFLTSSIRVGISILFGSVGETITEKSGHLNLGVPGVMAFGALGGCCGISIYNSIFGSENQVGLFVVLFVILFAMLFGAIMGALYSFFTVTLRSNQNITGLALTTLGVGCAKFFNALLDSSPIVSASNNLRKLFTFHDKLGGFGELFLSWGVLVYVAIIIAFVSSFLLKKTKQGLHLRAVGENPATADAAGINVNSYKYVSTIIGCAIAGLGGAYTLIDAKGASDITNTIDLIEAYGWLSVALVIFCIWKPSLCVVGSLLFGALYTLGSFVNFNADIIGMVPYLVTIIVLIFTSIYGGKLAQPPASLGVNYFREER